MENEKEMSFFDILTRFEGRINRGEFFVAKISLFVSMALFYSIISFIMDEGIFGILIVLILVAFFCIPFIWFNLAVDVKRWHDMGLSGWLALINFIPGLGTGVSFFVLAFVPGNPGSNKYGEVAAAVTVDDVAKLEKEK